MVRVAPTSPRPGASIDRVEDAVTAPSDQASQASTQSALVEHFDEITRLVDPHSPEGERIAQWLKGIGDRLLAADGTKLAHDVSYHLSDSKVPEAFVHMHEGRARIVISKGLFSVAKNEDQLATIIAHELMHVRFKEHFGTENGKIATTKVEEYFADVAACATWVIKAGYAPRESVAVFDALKERTAQYDLRVMRPWMAYSDVHGLLENRAQAISGLIAKELKEKGAVPSVATPFSVDIKNAITSSRHLSHFERLKADPSYVGASVEERHNRLVNELREITTATSCRMKECVAEFKEVFKSLPITAVVIEQVYGALKEHKLADKAKVLQAAYRAALKEGASRVVPSEIREMAQEIRTFVSSKSDQQLLSSGRKIAAFARAWSHGDPALRIALKSSFDFNPLTMETPPWEAQLTLARATVARGDTSIVEAMCALGAYDARILDFAPDNLLKSFHDIPLLTPCKNAEQYILDPGGVWRLNPVRRATLDDLTVMRESFEALVKAELNARTHKRAVETRGAPLERMSFESINDVPLETFARDVAGVVHLFSDEIVHPKKVQFYGGRFSTGHIIQNALADEVSALGEDLVGLDEEESGEGTISAELDAHYATAAALVRKFDEMLAHPDPDISREASAGIRAFFLNSEGPCFEALVGKFPEDGISTDKVCKHPLVTYAATCPALTAKERVEFLRGLENKLPAALWNKAYYSGYELTTAQEKLRHLNAVAPYQESALRAGASLIAHHFEKTVIDPTTVLPFIAEHRSFFPALRQLDDDARQPILDELASVRSWDAPLTDLIDVFWALEQAKLFPPSDSGVREMLREKIISEVEAIADPLKRKELAERVLLSPVAETHRISEIATPGFGGSTPHDAGSKRQEMFNRSAALLSLKDPVVRTAVTKVWADAVRMLVSEERGGVSEGRDDGSAGYISVAMPHLAHIVATIRPRLPVQERRELLGELAETLGLQETLAFYLRDSISEHSRATVADAHEYFRSAEAGFEFINQDAWRREAVVRFLAQPFTSESLHEFARRVDISRNREFEALTETVGGIVARHENVLADTRARMHEIERLTDERAWLGTLFSNANYEFIEFNDKVGSGDHDTHDLVASLDEIFPDAMPEDSRLAITKSVREIEDYVKPAHAKELLESCALNVKPALRAALEKERTLFEDALKAGLTDLEALQPKATQVDVDSIRRALFERLAQLPEYEFVESLESRIQGARGAAGLRSVIMRSLEGLSKSFDRECHREEARFETKFRALVRVIDKTQARIEKLLQSRPNLALDFHTQLRSLLSAFGDVLLTKDFAELYEFAERTPEEMSSIFEESDHLPVQQKLEVALGRLSDERERLVDREVILEKRMEKLVEMEERIKRDVVSLKRTPIPVHSVLEDAVVWLSGGEVEDGEEHGAFADDILAEFHRDYPTIREATDLAVTALEEQHARQFYELFWSQSAEVRSVALKLLLIPPEAEYQDRKSGTTDHFDKAFGFVVEQIFPEGMKYGAESKKILGVFLEETDPSLRGFMLAALIAASEKVAGAPEEYSAGKRLAMILSMLGPAEKKLGQAINSHPDTPEDLRSDTKHIKSMSDPLPRWELLQRVAEAVPESYRDVAIPRIGATLGAASYYIAVDCEDSVLSLLRPHARELARTGLDRMERVAIRLSTDPELSHVAGPFIESIQQAREMIELETNHEKGLIQQQNAWNRYEGLSIGVDDDTFEYSTAAWKGCGPEFRHQEKVEGEHFVDILERDGAEDPFVRSAALAHITAEFLNIVSGQPFDHDRHGSQSKIVKGTGIHTIGLFDHGCMALTPPRVEEKQQLANVLCDLVQGYLEGRTGLLERAHSIIREQRERDGVAPAYLVSVERALLALNDFMRFDSSGESGLLKRTDLGGVLAAVFRSGEVDPIFSSTIAQRFAGPTASMFLRFLSPDQLCAKIAEKIEEQAKGAPIISIRRSKGRMMPDPIVFGGAREAA